MMRKFSRLDELLKEGEKVSVIEIGVLSALSFGLLVHSNFHFPRQIYHGTFRLLVSSLVLPPLSLSLRSYSSFKQRATEIGSRKRSIPISIHVMPSYISILPSGFVISQFIHISAIAFMDYQLPGNFFPVPYSIHPANSRAFVDMSPFMLESGQQNGSNISYNAILQAGVLPTSTTFYILRPDTRLYVPLIPADELPIRLRGMPMAVSADELRVRRFSGVRYVGLVNRPTSQHLVEQRNDSIIK
jgi:hypothetical protein